MNITIENNLGVDLASTIMVLISTLLIIFIAKKYFWDAVLDYFEKRKEYLENEYRLANEAKENANKYKQQYEHELATAKQQVQVMIENAELEAKQTYNTIVSDAKKQSSYLIDKALETIELEKQQAELTMNEKIKTLAFVTAEKIIKKELSDDVKAQYVEDFIEHVKK